MASRQTIATKDLVIDGRPIPKGSAVPDWVEPARVTRGLQTGHFKRVLAAEKKDGTADAPATDAAPNAGE